MTVLHIFNGSNQYGVVGNMVMDGQENLYGTTFGFGANDEGMVFKLTPSSNSWDLADLYDFTYGNDGGNPSGDIAMDANGNLYGTTPNAGGGGYGTVWKVTP